MDDYIFDVMNENELMSHVEVTNNRKNVKIQRIVNKFPQPFMGDKLDLERVYRFLESRCFERERPDKDLILGQLGVSEYNPWEIVKKTHGRLLEDMIWVKFPTETICWEDLHYETLLNT